MRVRTWTAAFRLESADEKARPVVKQESIYRGLSTCRGSASPRRPCQARNRDTFLVVKECPSEWWDLSEAPDLR
jgi:hypothetical protein